MADETPKTDKGESDVKDLPQRDMEEESYIYTTHFEPGAEYEVESTNEIVMGSLRKVSGWKSAVYESGSIITVDDGTLVPDVKEFVESHVESSHKVRKALLSMARIAVRSD